MTIQENVSLASKNTFGLNVSARYFFEANSLKDVFFILKHSTFKAHPHFLLGGGSNILFINNFKGLVIKINIKGFDIIQKEKNHILIRIGGGENWHETVLKCLEKNYGGIENLSLIPGTVGAAPIQNIGAYGVELKDVFHSLEAVEIATGKLKTFQKEDCRFGYRNSFFKQAGKGKYILTSVTLRLTHEEHSIHASYGAIQNVLKEADITTPTIRDISNAVIQIRQSKLPDPKVLGNGGSFFKNPVISQEQFDILQKKFPNIVSYPQPNAQVKVPAGWLIEQAGWKGRRLGDAGCHEKQALVLVNHGNASGDEIWDLAQKIRESVNKKFSILLEPEINIVG